MGSRRIEWNGGGYGAPDETSKRRRVVSEVVGGRGDRGSDRGGDRGGGRSAYVSSGGPVYSRRCYVGNLAWQTSWQELKDAFRRCGNIVYANVTREDDGRSAGWGIVEFETPAEAMAAVQTMNDTDLGGRPIHVREDREDKEAKSGMPPPRSMGRGGGGGDRGDRDRDRGAYRQEHYAPEPYRPEPHRAEPYRQDRYAPEPYRQPDAYARQPDAYARQPAPYAGGGGGSSGYSRRCYVGNLAWRTSWQELKDAFRCCGNIVYANVTMETDGRSAGWGIVEFETASEAMAAVQSMNDTELGGRLIHVREDREDKEAKHAVAPPPAAAYGGHGHAPVHHAPPAQHGGFHAAPRAMDLRDDSNSSRLQIVVQGLPFAFTWKELKDMFAGVGDVERADIMIGADGRSKGWGTVRFGSTAAAQRGIGRWDKRELEGRTLAVFLDKLA